MRSGLMRAFVLTSGIIALSLLLYAGSAGADVSSGASYRTYAPGDLILSHEDKVYLWEKDVPMVSRECGENMTLLKEGYSFLYGNVDQIYIPASDGTVEEKRSANFSLYKNGEIVTQLNVKAGDFFYYNKTINGNEYTIIKFKVVSIFSADGLCGGYWAQIQPFFQYSDGTGGQEIQIGNSCLSPLAASPIQTLTVVPPETSTIIPTEKAAGFQFALAITILLAVYASGRK